MVASGLRRFWAWLDLSSGRVSSRVYLAPESFGHFGLTEGELVEARIGSGRGAGWVRLAAASSPAPWRSGRVKVRVSVDGSGRLRLGPLLGIMVSRHHSGNQVQRKMILAGHRLGVLVFIFTPDMVDLGRQRIRGYTLLGQRGRRRWSVVEFPLPDVIYNRILSRTLEAKPKIIRMKEGLRRVFGLSLFNPGFFNKWRLFRALGRVKGSREWLPQTELYRGAPELVRFLRRQRSAFFKPVNGRAGSGIFQVWHEEGQWACAFRRNGRTLEERYQKLSALAPKVRELVGNRPYIIQKWVKLTKFRGRKFDVRTLVQKDRQGRWRVTGMGARVAPHGGITTHVPQGGMIVSVNRALTQGLGSKNRMRELKPRLRALACAIAEAVESSQRKFFGEMSMDLGVEPSGRVWFFEANAKPMKFDEKLIQAKGILRILHFTCFLAGLK